MNPLGTAASAQRLYQILATSYLNQPINRSNLANIHPAEPIYTPIMRPPRVRQTWFTREHAQP